MKTIEERLMEHKQKPDNIQVPLELEDRLRNALHNIPVRKRKFNKSWIWAASIAAMLLLLVGSYQYPAFAYYGGKLLNKMELTFLSFSELADQGYGQKVNRSATFADGSIVTVNGVIADDNAFLMYYTIDLPKDLLVNDTDLYPYSVGSVTGLFTESNPREGNLSFDKDEYKYEGVYRFEPVSPFSRTLTVTFTKKLDSGETVSVPISFSYKANKAMKSIIEEDISQSVPVDKGMVHYDSITASPTSTIVKGHYAMDNGEYPRFSGNTKLYVNGTKVKAWGMRSDHDEQKGISGFELEYDVLPTDKIDSIELVLETFSGYQEIDEPISLLSPSDQSIKINNEKIWIRSVEKSEAGYDVVIARKQFTILDTDQLAIQAGENVVPVSSISSASPWDLKNGNILWEQTYTFNTTDRPELLLLDGFHYIKSYDSKLSIPVK